MAYAPVQMKKLAKDTVILQRAHTDDAGVGLSSVEGVVLAPGQRALVRTGVAIALPAGTAGSVHPRSGLAFEKGLSIVNAPGATDAGYRGEFKVYLINLSPTNTVKIAKGDRITQLVAQKVEFSPMVGVDELDETEHGAGGHGPTGVSTTL